MMLDTVDDDTDADACISIGVGDDVSVVVVVLLLLVLLGGDGGGADFIVGCWVSALFLRHRLSSRHFAIHNNNLKHSKRF